MYFGSFFSSNSFGNKDDDESYRGCITLPYHRHSTVKYPFLSYFIVIIVHIMECLARRKLADYQVVITIKYDKKGYFTVE